jgi:nucleoside-diphosphate-sugar epimerase
MHIFLTGATGFVGKHLLYYILKDTDFTVTIPVRQKKLTSAERFQKEFVEAPLFNNLDLSRVTCIDRDISNIVAEDLSGACFIHCAAVVKFNQPLEDLIKHNYKSVEGLYELAATNSMKFIYISTCYTHPKGSAGESVQIPADLPRESFICDYAYTKYLAEQWLYKQPSASIVRLSCVGAPLDDLPPMRGPAHLGILEVGYRRTMADVWFPDNFQFSVVPVDVVCKNLIEVIKSNADGIQIKQFSAADSNTYNISALELAKPVLKENNITYWNNMEFKTFTMIMTALYFWIPETLQKIIDVNYIISTVSSNITFQSSIEIPHVSKDEYLTRTREYVRRLVETDPKGQDNSWKHFLYQLFLMLKKWLVKILSEYML